MNTQDYLHLRTTNINVRISPILKSQLIERGAKMGVNLSDYIGYVLTKDMTGQNDPQHSEEYKTLQKKYSILQTELSKYESLVEPFKNALNTDILIDGKIRRFQTAIEILTYLTQNFKIKN